MMKQHTPFFRLLGITFLASILLFSCEKSEITIPPEMATFLNETGDAYSITNAGVTYELGVGVTTVSDKERTIAFTVTSPTGAVLGTDYTLESPVVVIPAGQAVGKIVVKGNFSAYQAGEKDTLVFTLQSPSSHGASVAASDFNSVFKLLMRGPCFEGDVNLNDLLGDYAKTNETFGTSPYGPYTTSISSVNQLTPTTGTIVVNNIWDFGWGPITFMLDWTDPANRTAEVIPQESGIADAGTISSAYAGEEVAVQPFAGEPGTFSVCNGTLTLKMQLGVAGLGYFNQLYTVNMAR